MPANRTAMTRFADRMGWNDPARAWDATANPDGIWRKRAGRGGGVEYHVSALGADAQARLMLVNAVATEPFAQEPVERARLSAAQHWEWFDAQTDKVKDKAKARLSLLQKVEALVQNGQSREVAIALVSQTAKTSGRSIWRWFEAVAGLNRQDWLPALADRHAGGGKAAELEPDAWEAFKADYLRLEQPTITACYRRLEEMAVERGWKIPAEKSIARKIEREIHRSVLVLARQGLDALKQLVPPLKRDRSGFHALEAINGDGHKWDVFVQWPDGTIGRPMMVAFQDLYSNKMLAWRFDKSENREAIRLALGDVVEQFGLPDHIWFDNTKAFANKWLTGGASHRYRFKTRDEDPIGLCESMGISVHFTLPYSGQSKPIERSFRDYAGDIAKHPAFAGAYVGNTPLAKPENYRSRAVPFDDFVRVVGQEINKWNARGKRRTDIARGRSFDEVFAESYTRASTLIRKPSEAMMRQWRLAAEGIRVHRQSGAVSLLGNTFWDSWLNQYAGEKLIVRFDPQNVHAGVHLYDPAGRYLGFAPVYEAGGFADVNRAREHARTRNDYMKAVKVQLAAERTMDALKYAAMLPDPPEGDQPEVEHTVIHHAFRSNGSAALAVQAVESRQHDQDDYLDRIGRGLRLISDEDDI